MTHVQDGTIKSATTCDRVVQNRLFINNQETSCYTLNENICTGFLSQFKSRLDGNKLNLVKIAECSLLSAETEMALLVVNNLMKNSENAKVADAGMKRAIGYATDLSKDVSKKRAVPIKNDSSNGKFEEWLAKSRFDSASIAFTIAKKCYELNLVKNMGPAVNGVDYKKAGHERPQIAPPKK